MGKRRRGGPAAGGGICHEWRREGSCSFGDKCRFRHLDPAEGAEDPAARAAKDAPDDAEVVQDGNCVPLFDRAATNVASRGPIKRPRSVEERSFTERVATDGTTRVLEHPNGLLIVLLADTHPLRAAAAASEITAVRYAENLQDVEVSGKRKHGAVKVDVGSTLITASLRDGSSFEVKSPVVGRVMETNPRLETETVLLAGREGYLAVLSQSSKHAEKPTALLPRDASRNVQASDDRAEIIATAEAPAVRQEPAAAEKAPAPLEESQGKIADATA